MAQMNDEDWGEFLQTSRKINEKFNPGVIYIGGLAVFMHTLSDPDLQNVVSFTHDGDFMISEPDYSDLRDIETVMNSRRGSKVHFIKNGFEFDVYVEGVHDLPVPYDEVALESEIHGGLRISCPEHLLILKHQAQIARKGTRKGDKDEDDMLKLLVVIGKRGTSSEKVARIDDNLIILLKKICSSSGDRITMENRHIGRQLRQLAKNGLEAIKSARCVDLKLC